ncbi:MAG: hypothetical protein ACLP3B_22360 [Syntrophobacteraceae bacterium]
MIQNILLCGLPESGKTTFLAALWYLLFHKEIPTVLSLGAFPQNREYLNELSGRWSRFIEFTRTSDELQEILLRLKDGPSEIDFHIPDMSGETWEAIWSTRFCAEDAAKWVQTASGVMLSVHADKFIPPVDIMTCKAMAETAGISKSEVSVETKPEAAVNESEPRQETPSGAKPIPWSPGKSATQVILVDILQALARPPLGREGRRLAVMISAWDKAMDTYTVPNEFLKANLPLLHQFLHYGGKYSAIKIYGISALGGDLTSTEDAKRVKAEGVPSRRIKVVEGEQVHHDLTAPIKWLMADD